MPGSLPTTEINTKTFGDYYSKPSWWFRWRYDTQIKRKTLLSLIKTQKKDWSGKVIFELGFGSGNIIFSFPIDCEIYGLELSSSAISRASEQAIRMGYKKYCFFENNGNHNYPLKSDSVDLAIASHVLEHVHDDVLHISNLCRILKKGGMLAILIPINERFHDPNHLNKYTVKSLKTLCENCGFRFIYGFENELLFYFVEKLYQRYQNKKWALVPNIIRITFNLMTAPLPYPLCVFFDFVIKSLTSLPPRQAALLFIK